MQDNSNRKPTSKDRLLQFFELHSISLHKFYEKTGIPNDYLTKEGDIDPDLFKKILNFCPELSLVWLLTGNGSMLPSQQGPEVISTTTQETTASFREQYDDLDPVNRQKKVQEAMAYLRDYIKRLDRDIEGLQNKE
jgi:hypothetical protein